MYDEPSRVNSLRNHLVKDTSDRPLEFLLKAAKEIQSEKKPTPQWIALSAATRPAQQATCVSIAEHNTASPETSGTGPLIC